MVSTATADRSVRALAGQIGTLSARLETLEAGGRTNQLGDSSLENGYISIYDDSGVVRAILGKQGDGTFLGGNSVNNPLPPPVPKAPRVASVIAGLKVTGQGSMTGSWPADFARMNIYAQDHTNPTPSLVGTLASDDDVMILSPLDVGSTWDVWLTSVNLSGKESIASDIASGSPDGVVASAITDGAITTLKLADDAVTTAKIAAQAVTATEVAPNSISSPMLVAGAVQTINLAADSVAAGKIAAQAITAREVLALSLTANELAANSVTASKISAGSVTASKLQADLVIASRIIAGATPTGPRVELHPTAGIQGFQADGTTRTFWLDAATGNFTAVGTMATAFAGQRITINPGGTSPDTIRFWPSSGSAYASIDSITSPGGAGIEMYGATTGTKRGIVIAREDFASLIYGTTDLNTIQTDIFASPTIARMRGGTVQIMADYGNPSGDVSIALAYSNGASIVPKATLRYQNTGADGGEPWFAAASKDSGITFAESPGTGLNARVYVVGNQYTVRRDLFLYSLLYEGDLVKPSSQIGKRNVVPAHDLDLRHGTRMARAHRYEKAYLDEGPVYDPDGVEQRGARPAPVQLGLIAEHVPEQAQQLIPQATPDRQTDILGINTDVLTTLTWQGLGEVYDRLDALDAAPPTIPHTITPPLAPSQGALLYEHNGQVWAVTATGQRTRLT